jgi:hypothetical protein
MEQVMKRKLLAIAAAAAAMLGPVGAQAWNTERWDTDDRCINKNYDWPEQCVPVYDPLLPGSPLLGDFCYAASGTLRVHDLDFKTITRFSGSGNAKLYAPGTHTAPGTGTALGSTLFTLRNRTVTAKNDLVKSFRMSFDSNQFQVGTGADCRVISVELKFTGRNQIACLDTPPPAAGGVCQNPQFDFTRETDEVVVAPCLL